MFLTELRKYFRFRSSAESAASESGAAGLGRHLYAAELAGWLPLAAFFFVIVALWARGSTTVYERPALAATLYLVFALPAASLVAVLLARSFLTQGAAKLLLVGMGALFWACAGTAGSMAGISKGHADFTNTLLTIHNLGMWLSALCHLVGATLTVQWRGLQRNPRVWLAAGYGLALATMAGLVLATLAGVVPPFFVPGQGATTVRKLVLFSTAAMLGVTGILFAAQQQTRPRGFTFWYGQALLFFAAGVIALVLSVPGTLLGWTGRITLAVGSVLMLIGVLKSLRWRTGQDFVPEARLPEGGLGYAVAVAAVSAAAAMRVVFLPALEGRYPIVTFLPALVLAALYGGWRAGVLATVLAAVTAIYFWVEPLEQFSLKHSADWLGIGVFLALGVMIAWMADRIRAAEAVARQAEVAVLAQRDRLEGLVRERTAKLVEARDLLAESQKIAHLGSFEYLASTKTTVWSEEEYHIYGLDPARPSPPYEELLARFIHPEDVAELHEKFLAAMQSCSIYEFEHRIVRPDGSVLWVYDRAQPYFDESGNLLRYVGTTLDITDQKRAEEQMRASEEKYRTLFSNLTEGFVLGEPVLDPEGKPVDLVYLEVNEAFYRHTGMPKGMAGGSLREHFPQVEQEWIDRYAAVALTGQEDHFERYNVDSDRYYEVHVFGPRPGRFAILFRDITDRRRAEAALRESESRLALALKAAGTAVWEMDVSTLEIIPASDLVFTMLGYAPGEIRTSPEWLALIHQEDLPGVPEMIRDLIEGRRDSYWRELRLRAKDGQWHWILSQATAAERDAQGKAVRLVGTHTDIDERKLAEERVREAALHDTLTGLPNRALVFEYGSHLLAAARRNHGRGALLFIDLDRFKPINDLYGHEVGDRVLQEVATRLVTCTRHEDLVGRLGGDEFVILLPFLDGAPHRASVVAQHVITSIGLPFGIDSLELSLSPSIGISYYPEHATEVGTLIHTADLAMYQAKQSGRGRYEFYRSELDQQADAAYSLEAKLKTALRTGSLELHYQPVVDISSGELIGAEALVRLPSSDGNAVGPASFIPIAETAGLIGDLGDWVMNEACRQHEAWRKEGLQISIAINVSPLQFRERNFSDRVRSIFTRTGVDPTCFQLEITESTIMANIDEAVGVLQKVKALGLTVALDDFGTGYSSLSSLSSLPLDKLKVDQSFVRRIGSDQASRVVTEAIIGLGRSLKLEVTGEGIESEEALDYLRDHGCNHAQGYWFSKPLPAWKFAQWCRERQVH